MVDQRRTEVASKVQSWYALYIIKMGKSVPKNSLCPCGSDKKYKYCCFARDWKTKQAQRKTVTFSLDDSG